MQEYWTIPGPLPKDVHALTHWNMVYAHSMLMHAFDSVYTHLQNPPTDDLPNFLGYCSLFTEVIIHHHDIEEAVLFPFLNTKLDFSSEIDDHKFIHDYLDRLDTLIKEAQVDHSKFNPQKMIQLMDELKDPLVKHLSEEIQDLEADKLRVFDAKEVEDMITRLDDKAKEKATLTKFFPFGLSHMSDEARQYWPPFLMSPVIRKFIIPYVVAMPYRGYWKYSPYKL